MSCQSISSPERYFFIPPVLTSVFLEQPKIISKLPMREFLEQKGHVVHFTSSVYFARLEGGAQAVLKIVDPEDTFEIIAEAAAYRAACFLGLDFVPPTTLYAENGEIGSVQAYVEPLCDLMVGNNYQEVCHQISPEEWANIQIFYFVFGQWDPDPSNMIVTKDEEVIKLALIDNAAMGYCQKVKYGEHPFVLCFQNVVPVVSDEGSFPFEKVETLSPDKEVWRERFGDYLLEWQINQLCRLREDVRFVLWKGHLWRQYQFGKPACTDLYPVKTMDALEKLTLQNLKEFSENALGFQFQDEYFTDILERRDQILKAYRMSSDSP